MSAKTIVKLTSAGLIGATLIASGASAIAAPMGIAPKATVEAASPVTDVQWRGRGWGWRGYGWRRGGAPWVAGAVLGGLALGAAAAASPYYYDAPYAYDYVYAPGPYYYARPYGYGYGPYYGGW